MAKGSALIRTALRGVGRRSRDSGASMRISQAELVRYVGPGRALVHSHGMVVWLRATDGEVSHCGVGEAVAAPAQSAAAWRRLKELSAGLVGATAPSRVDSTQPLAAIDGWQPVRAADSGAARAAKLALETALLDLLMSTGALPAVGVADPPVMLPTHRLPRVAPGAPADDLTPVLGADAGAWALRLRLTGDTTLDLAWLRHAAERERAAGRQRPLWMVGGDRELDAAHELVGRVCELIGTGELPELVLLEEPLARKQQSSLVKYQQRSALSRLGRRSPLSRLQQAADEALGRTRPGAAAGPRLAIVAGDSVSAPAQVKRLVEGWPIGGLHLSPARWGSLAGFQEAARIAKASGPATLVLLGGGRGSRLTGQAMQWLATTTREIDRYVPEVPAAPWPTLATARRGPRTGLFEGVDLAELATVADEVTAFPRRHRPPTTEAPNRFPDHPLPGEALARRSMLLETEALRGGLATRRLSRDVFFAEEPGTGRTIGFSDSESSATTVPAAVSAARKGVTRDLLAAQGLPVPEGATFGPPDQRSEYQAAYARARQLGFPLVVKPAGGTKGVAVTVGITTEPQLRRALEEVAASRYADTGVVVERFVTGTDYRVLATREQVLSVVRREPASVVGDGHRSVEEMVVAANAARRQNPHLARRLITLDARVDEQLARQGLTRRSVPPLGLRVRLRAEANFSLGGESFEVLESTHPSVCALAVAAVAAVPGLPHAGLDILMDDHQLPAGAQNITIIEVNSRPVQSIHHFPMYGPPRNVSRQLVRDAAGAAGVRLRPAADELTVRATITGRVQAVGYRRWMVRAAKQLGVSGWVANATEPDRVHAMVHGKAAWVGMMLRLAYDGPPGAAVVEVLAEPADVPPASGFVIRPDVPR